MTVQVNSGFYIVILSNVEPISSQRGDPRNEDTAIKVNKDNVKVGKTTNLVVREKQYQKTFGAKHVSFRTLAIVKDIDAVDKLVKKEL